MKYGFVIDNRKCIGCHACTTACKSEHEVPVGVNRTYVKQVEKGTFPDVRRFFSVMRCNHCTDAPCVGICPTEALFIRKDGIVDFDNDRCIGCKSCTQACPYDALYIDPDTNTAAKCNYCAHRIDVGLEPACVNVCPEEAIISGDMEDPESNIFKLLNRTATKVRKPEKGTLPNVFYIDADDVSLVPSNSEKSTETLWGGQVHGVGHYAKEAEKLALSNQDIKIELEKHYGEGGDKNSNAPKTVDVLRKNVKNVYDTPGKGLLWGWEVSAYVWTKAIAAGLFLMAFLLWISGNLLPSDPIFAMSIGGSLLFQVLTGALLVKDLDRPDRFLYVLLRPHWESWLVRGGYAIAAFGLITSIIAASLYFDWNALIPVFMYVGGLVALVVAIYTAFLFAQAKGRDFWQSPVLPFHMLNHAFMAGAAIILFLAPEGSLSSQANFVLWISLLINLAILTIELAIPHPTQDSKKAVELIAKKVFAKRFWIGVVLLGNILPLLLCFIDLPALWGGGLIAALVLFGIYQTEAIWVEAPQHISLS